MRQLLNVFTGALVVTGYFLWESLIFGSIIWYVWGVTNLGGFTTLGMVTWFQAVAIVLIIKILKFDSAKLIQKPAPTPIILTEELLKFFANKEKTESKN